MDEHSEAKQGSKAADEPLITAEVLKEGILPLCALYASIEGGVKVYESVSGAELEFWFKEGFLFKLFNYVVFGLFVTHWITSLQEAYRKAAAAIILLVVVVIATGLFIIVPKTAVYAIKDLNAQGQKYIDMVSDLPVGTIFYDPYLKKQMIKSPIGPEPLENYKYGTPEWLKTK